jgi:hypothetical protein
VGQLRAGATAAVESELTSYTRTPLPLQAEVGDCFVVGVPDWHNDDVLWRQREALQMGTQVQQQMVDFQPSGAAMCRVLGERPSAALALLPSAGVQPQKGAARKCRQAGRPADPAAQLGARAQITPNTSACTQPHPPLAPHLHVPATALAAA